MGNYVVTGGSGGIGASIISILKEKGHRTINVDIKGGDINDTIATPEGRENVIKKVYEMCPEGLDGLVCNAGVNGACGNLNLIVSLNFYGTTEITKGLWPLVQKKRGSIVITSSNSIIQGRGVDLAHLLASGIEEELALRMLSGYDPKNLTSGHEVYVATKYAQALWLRRMASTSAARGVRVNGVAPGNVQTPMTMDAGEAAVKALEALPMPTKYGSLPLQGPEEIANVICFLLSEESKGINGSIVFTDGGTDALLRPDSVC